VYLLSTNFALNFILSAALNQLLSMIRIIQLLALFPLIDVKIPANAAKFFGFLLQVASFDVLPVSSLYDKYLQNNIAGVELDPKFE
jgi:hypothetical protein